MHPRSSLKRLLSFIQYLIRTLFRFNMNCIMSPFFSALCRARAARRDARKPNNDAAEAAALAKEEPPPKPTKLHALFEVTDARETSRFLKDIFGETGLGITHISDDCVDVALSGNEGSGTTVRFVTAYPDKSPRVLPKKDLINYTGLRMCLEVADLESICVSLGSKSCPYEVSSKSDVVNFFLEYVVWQTSLPLVPSESHMGCPHMTDCQLAHNVVGIPSTYTRRTRAKCQQANLHRL